MLSELRGWTGVTRTSRGQSVNHEVARRRPHCHRL